MKSGRAKAIPLGSKSKLSGQQLLSSYFLPQAQTSAPSEASKPHNANDLSASGDPTKAHEVDGEKSEADDDKPIRASKVTANFDQFMNKKVSAPIQDPTPKKPTRGKKKDETTTSTPNPVPRSRKANKLTEDQADGKDKGEVGGGDDEGDDVLEAESTSGEGGSQSLHPQCVPSTPYDLLPHRLGERCKQVFLTVPKGDKYTPLEQQIVALKQQYPDILLMFEVGYKYRWFGPDAEITARLLQFYLHPDRHFLTCSGPTGRANIYIQCIINGGYKVCHVFHAHS